MARAPATSSARERGPSAKPQDERPVDRSRPSSPSLGDKSADALTPAERGGSASTEGRTGSEGGLGSPERSKSQEQSRGGQMGPGGARR